MDKKFEEMSFDELKLIPSRRIYGDQLGILFLIVIVIVGMVLHGSWIMFHYSNSISGLE